MNSPKVSVLLPNLNNREFLDERIQSILNQTLTEFELVVVDNFSDDGAWELIQSYAARDKRMRISQALREGMYANWNNCIRLAQGKYIYIATSDDTMVPDCLEKMVSALDAYPGCGLCHCCLQIIDENGNRLNNSWEKYPPQIFYGDRIHKIHIRKAPLDGLLHYGLFTVYHSITQLLIRRDVFETVGLFRSDWGSYGDFEWDMRASLIYDTIHIPEYLATWRIHHSQATKGTSMPEHCQNLLAMCSEAIKILKYRNSDLYSRLDLNDFRKIYIKEEIFRAFKNCRTTKDKLRVWIKYSMKYPQQLAKWGLLTLAKCRPLQRKVCFVDGVNEIRRKVRERGFDENIHIQVIDPFTN